jgi:hypothetical protein
MAGPSFEEWISHLGLQQINDRQIDKPIYRKTSFGELELSAEIEKKISTSLRIARDRRKIPRSKLVPMLGLSDQVYNPTKTRFRGLLSAGSFTSAKC